MSITYYDAYCHIGLPRFGAAEDAMAVLNQNRVEKTVPLFERTGLAVPMQLYQTLHRRYVKALQLDAGLSFSEFIVRQLDRQ